MKAYTNTTDKPHIVAIDDSPIILSFLSNFLKERFEVTTFRSTSEALKHLTEGIIMPDCVVTDYHLRNDLSGLEFTQELKQVDPILPVLVLSGSCNMNEKIQCLQSGAVDFVSKPFNPMELNVRIANAIALNPQRNQYRHAV